MFTNQADKAKVTGEVMCVIKMLFKKQEDDPIYDSKE